MRRARIVLLLSLLVAGEAVFGLPFHVARFFRPTLLSALHLRNTELGSFFAAYGVFAMLSYLPGGLLADRFSARRLLALALVSTGLGGIYFSTLPDRRGLVVLFAVFGLTTILPFWGALIRATRHWGGRRDQGKAFGLLDGGRGLFAAALASLALVPFQMTMGPDPSRATDATRLVALDRVIYVYTAATLAAAVLVWLVVPDESPRETISSESVAVKNLRTVFRSRKVWLQAAVVVCAYCGFKALDNYSLFAVQAYGMNEVAGARLSVLGSWLRPLSAVGAGVLADRISPSRTTAVCFALLIAGYGGFVFVAPGPHTLWLLFVNVAITSAAVFGLRGVYFALLEESRVPSALTGTAVGVISVVGFTPDVFIAPVIGLLLDKDPGPVGHRHVFLLLGAIAVTGLVVTLRLRAVSVAQSDVDAASL